MWGKIDHKQINYCCSLAYCSLFQYNLFVCHYIYLYFSLQFLQWYSSLQDEWLKDEDSVYTNYSKQLSDRKDECSQLLSQVTS